MQHPHLSVIMPAYNEGESLFENLHVTVSACRQFEIPFEVLVVDDGSVDNTAETAEQAATLLPEVRVVSYSPNHGKGYAVLTGARMAAGDLIAFIDSDLDIHPSQLATALHLCQTTDADVVIGSKWHPESRVVFPKCRRIVSFGYYMLVRLLFGLPVRDTQTGIKLFRRSVMARMVDRVASSGYTFDLEMLALANSWGYRIKEMPVTVNSRRLHTRIRLVDIYRMTRDTLRVFFRLSMNAATWTSPPQPAAEEAAAKAGRS